MTNARIIRKLLPMLVLGSVLMEINCGPIAVTSVKNGVLNWITGSAQQFNTDFLGDLVINALTGNSQNTDTL